MDFKDFTAGINDNDRRLDKIIRNFIKNASLPEIYKALRKGLIKVNRKKCKPEIHIFEGDVISIASFLIDNQNIKNNKSMKKTSAINKSYIIFENSDLLILNKPYDINVHGDDNSLDKQVLDYFNLKNQNTSLSFTPGPLHRLDKKTTGLIAFSFSLNGARWFAENIKNHSITKIYYAIMEGIIDSADRWEDLITNKNENSEGFYKVTASNDETDEDSKTAITEVKPLAYGKYNDRNITFMEIHILTGRKHQIRAQSALHGHPLLGDTTYGGSKIIDNKQSLFLHAGKLMIPSNPLGLPEILKVPLPESFQQFLKYCGIDKIEL